jgi:hypothetical protein
MLTGPTSKSDVRTCSTRPTLLDFWSFYGSVFVCDDCMWVARRDGPGNARKMRAQPTHSNLIAYVLHAVQTEVCTTGTLANFIQTLEFW